MAERKTYIIGDIHGYLTKFQALLDALPLEAGDKIVILGDMVDRGPEPRKVIQKILDLRSEGWDVVALKGNHEQMMLNVFRNNLALDLFVYNGGRNTLRDYRRKGELWLPRSHAQFFQNLALYYEAEDFICVHAGLAPGVPLHEQDEEDLLWIREQFLLSDYDFGKLVIHGHTIVHKPDIKQNRIGIDTGACGGGLLTCLSMPDREFYFSEGPEKPVLHCSVDEVLALDRKEAFDPDEADEPTCLALG